MNQILTDEEITLIVRECARGSAINRDGSTSHRIARAIESAVLAKLREQEPVAWLHKVRSQSDVITDEVKMFLLREYERWHFHSSVQRHQVCKAEHYTIPLFEHPIPEQEPVAYMNSDSFDKLLSTISCWTLVQNDSDAGFDMPLYAEPRPAPIPEGWKELMVRTISRMRAAHVPCADIERSAEAMLAAARSE